MTDTRTRQLAAALRYAKLGWAVLPLHSPAPRDGCSCGVPTCSSPAKHPRTRRGIDDASTTPRTVIGWWRRWPDANVAIATGTAVVVLDVDGHHGEQALDSLERAHQKLPDTLTAATGHGHHHYFLAPAAPLNNSAGRLGDGLDVRAHRGYVVAPPSQHPTGRPYRWTRRRQPAPLPAWILDELTPDTRHIIPLAPTVTSGEHYFEAALNGELQDIAAAPVGARNDTLNRAAFRLGQLAAAGHGEPADIASHLHAAAVATGLEETETHATINSGLQAGLKRPRQPADTTRP